MKTVFAGLVAIGLLMAQGSAQPAQAETHSLAVDVDVDDEMSEIWTSSGRLFVFISKTARPEPRMRTWPDPSQSILAHNIAEWRPDQKQALNDGRDWIRTFNHDLYAIPSGEYYLQALWDQDTLESRINAPGNLYSQVERVILNKDRKVQLTLDQQIPPRTVVDHPNVRYIEVRSEILSQWWQKDIVLKATVLLPFRYSEDASSYPLRVNIAGYGGRYTRINQLMADRDFRNWWLSDASPGIVTLFLDGEGPFGDCYQLDSENSGPYGRAVTEELIPHVESLFHCVGTPKARFLDGCSTGGWVSLALQVFYPDYFNGTWSYSPDPVDFTHNQLINIYKDKNAFYNEWGYLRPVSRDVYGEPRISLKDFIQFENVLGRSNTYVTSGGQFSAFTALYSPRGDDGLPQPLFDPATGDIDRAVAARWKQYDLRAHVEGNWAELGPKLHDKLWIWMGDMDNYYLNPALRSFEEMLSEQNNPASNATITFDPMQGHCWAYDHRQVLEMIEARYQSVTPNE